MSLVVNIVQFLAPVSVLFLAVVLLCFYHRLKKRREVYDVTTEAREGVAPSADNVASPSENQQGEVGRLYDRYPPRYSTVEPPPPYSLFDPNLSSFLPGGPPPPYEMYPIALPHY